MPENWNPTEQVQDKVVVPILKALPLIKSLTQNGHIVTNNGLSFFRTREYFKLIVAASRSKGGGIYLDKQILELVDKNNFEKLSDKMVAMLPEENIDQLVELLQVNHSLSVTIQSYHLKDLKSATNRFSNRKKIELPTMEEKPDTLILELEAEALILELQLKLNFGNISASNFPATNKLTPINTLNVENFAIAAGNESVRATVYALGRVDMILTNREARTVQIVNNDATDYDWNRGGGPIRDNLIKMERGRAGLNDTHGFKTFYYGIGTLNTPFTPRFERGAKF
jgi:hypothetical protein